MENYEIVEKIGEGTYGAVYKCRYTVTGQVVAIKKVKPNKNEDGIPATTIREISILKEIKHKNIISLLDVLIENNNTYLVLEHMTMDLRMYLDSMPKGVGVDEKLVQSYMYQISNAVKFCHCRRVWHRDLKPQNLLIDKNGVIKLADFGLGRSVGIPVRVYTHEISTLWYRAPEILLGSLKYSCSVDIWSIGCIFAEMVTRIPLFPGDSEVCQLFQIFRTLTTPTEATWPGVTKLPDYKPGFPKWTTNRLANRLPHFEANSFDLIKKMLIYNPVKRISAKQIVEHSYFRSFKVSMDIES